MYFFPDTMAFLQFTNQKVQRTKSSSSSSSSSNKNDRYEVTIFTYQMIGNAYTTAAISSRIIIFKPSFVGSLAIDMTTAFSGGLQRRTFSATKRYALQNMDNTLKQYFFLQVKSFTSFCTKHNVQMPRVGDAGFLVSFSSIYGKKCQFNFILFSDPYPQLCSGRTSQSS